MIDIGSFGIGLRITDAAFRAVISTNAAASALREIRVVQQENRELIG